METKTWIAKDGEIYTEENGKTIALIPYFDKENAEHVKNQNLISFAPQMHKLLSEIVLPYYYEDAPKEIVQHIQEAKRLLYELKDFDF